MKRDLAYFRGLPYEFYVDRFVEEEDGKIYYRAAYRELPAIQGVHQDSLLAINLARELFDSYVEAQLEWGNDLPEPAPRFRAPGGQLKISTTDSSEGSDLSVSSVKPQTVSKELQLV